MAPLLSYVIFLTSFVHMYSSRLGRAIDLAMALMGLS